MFEFLKKRIIYNDIEFNNPKFLEQIMVIAIYHFNQNGNSYDLVKNELLRMKPKQFSEVQAEIIIEKLKYWVNGQKQIETYNVLQNKVTLLARAEKYNDGYDLIQSHFNEDPDNVNLIDLLYVVGYYFKSEEEIIDDINKLIIQYPNQKLNLLYKMGHALKYNKSYLKSKEVFKILTENRVFAWDYYQIGIIENLLGNKENCLLNLKKTFEIDSNLKEDAQKYEELRNLIYDKEFIELTK